MGSVWKSEGSRGEKNRVKKKKIKIMSVLNVNGEEIKLKNCEGNELNERWGNEGECR